VDVPQRPVPTKDLRASDGDRERVASILNDAMTDGRLSMEEHSQRIEGVYNAVTLGDLTAFTLDLMPADQQPFRVDSQSLYALFGNAQRDGRWVVPAKLPIAALFGTVELDLREAVLQRKHIVLDVTALCGRVRILVPDGVEVRVTGRTVLTSRDLKVRPMGDGPVVEIRGTFVLGSVKAQAPKRRWRDRIKGL